MRIIYIYGSLLRSIESFTISPKSQTLHAGVIIPVSQMEEREAQRDEWIRPRALMGANLGLEYTHTTLLPEHPLPLHGAFTNLSLGEDETSFEKVPADSA